MDGYGWETWLPWFRAVEGDRDFGGAPWHGDAGPIPISRYPRADWHELQERFAEAALSAGHAWVDDHNAPGALGIGPVPLNMLEGRAPDPGRPLPRPGARRARTCRCAPGVLIDRVRFGGDGRRGSRSSAPRAPRRSPPTR